MVNALRVAGHQVAVVCPIAWTDILRAKFPAHSRLDARHCDDASVTFPHYYYPPKFFRPSYGWFMWQCAKNDVNQSSKLLKPQAVLSYWAHPDGRCAIKAAKHLGIPAIVITGGSDVLLLAKTNTWGRCVRAVMSDADAIVAVSTDLRNKLIEFGVPSQKVHVVRRGVDVNIFKTGSREEARIALGLSKATSILLWVGRMSRVKGLSILLEALQLLYLTGLDCETVLVGSGELTNDVLEEIQRRGLNSRIRLDGAVAHSTLATYYQAADITVLPSFSEGVPNVLLESIACGTPFIASEVGGIPEIATSTVDYLVPPGDARALANAIRQRLQRPAANNIRREFLPYDWSNSAKGIVDVIRPLVQDSARGSCLHPSG